MSDVWKTLSAIDCSKHVEKKGKLSYLSWTWAWQILNEHYPDSTYEYYEPTFLEDGTAEVSVALTVEGKTQSRFLGLAYTFMPAKICPARYRMRLLTLIRRQRLKPCWRLQSLMLKSFVRFLIVRL